MTASVLHSTLDHTVELTSVLVVTKTRTVFMDAVAVGRVTLVQDMSVRKLIKSRNVVFVLFIITASVECASVCLDLFVKSRSVAFVLSTIIAWKEDVFVFQDLFVIIRKNNVSANHSGDTDFNFRGRAKGGAAPHPSPLPNFCEMTNIKK